jgi:hypothetical protein
VCIHIFGTPVHTAEPLVLDLCSFEVKITIKKLKSFKLPGTAQILAELIEAGNNVLTTEIHKLINSILNKEELPQQWKESVVPIYKKCDKN